MNVHSLSRGADDARKVVGTETANVLRKNFDLDDCQKKLKKLLFKESVPVLLEVSSSLAAIDAY